jgi:chromosome segregation ATPase
VVSDKQRAVTAPETQQRSSNANNARGDNDMDELKSMIQTLLTNSEIARKEANAQARQVQRWSKTCRSLASQVSELHKVVETLSQASSYSGSTMSSVTASLERVRQAQKDCPIPMEVILDQQSGGNTRSTIGWKHYYSHIVGEYYTRNV